MRIVWSPNLCRRLSLQNCQASFYQRFQDLIEVRVLQAPTFKRSPDYPLEGSNNVEFRWISWRVSACGDTAVSFAAALCSPQVALTRWAQNCWEDLRSDLVLRRGRCLLSPLRPMRESQRAQSCHSAPKVCGNLEGCRESRAPTHDERIEWNWDVADGAGCLLASCSWAKGKNKRTGITPHVKLIRTISEK